MMGSKVIRNWRIRHRIRDLKVKRHDLLVERETHKRGSERRADISKELSKTWHEILNLECLMSGKPLKGA